MSLTCSFNRFDGRVRSAALHGWRVHAVHAIALLGDEVQHIQQHPELLVHFVLVQLGLFDLLLQLFGQLCKAVGTRHFLFARRSWLLLLVVLLGVGGLRRGAVVVVVQMERVQLTGCAYIARLVFLLVALQ